MTSDPQRVSRAERYTQGEPRPPAADIRGSGRNGHLGVMSQANIIPGDGSYGPLSWTVHLDSGVRA